MYKVEIRDFTKYQVQGKKFEVRNTRYGIENI